MLAAARRFAANAIAIQWLERETSDPVRRQARIVKGYASDEMCFHELSIT